MAKIERESDRRRTEEKEQICWWCQDEESLQNCAGFSRKLEQASSAEEERMALAPLQLQYVLTSKGHCRGAP